MVDVEPLKGPDTLGEPCKEFGRQRRQGHRPVCGEEVAAASRWLPPAC
jgi:hypothetical protein